MSDSLAVLANFDNLACGVSQRIVVVLDIFLTDGGEFLCVRRAQYEWI